MSRRKAAVLWLSGLLIVGLLVSVVSPASVGTTISRMDLGLLAWAAALSCVATLLGAVNSYLLLSISHPIGFRPYLGYYWLAWALGLVFPGQVGDVGMLSWLMKRRGMRWTHSLGRLLLDKLVSFGVISCVAAWGLLGVLQRLDMSYARLAWVAGAAVVAGALALAAMKVPRVRRIADHALAIITEALGVARRHPGLLLANVLITPVKLVLLALAFWYVFKSVGVVELPFLVLFQLMAVSSIVAYLPISMNGVGTAEATGIALFSLYGVEAAGVLSAYLVTRVMTLALAWLPSLIGLAFARLHPPTPADASQGL